MREQGQIDQKYPSALPVLSDLDKDTAEQLKTLFGSLTWDGQEYVYNGQVSEDGPYWYDAEENDRVGGIFFLAERMKKVLDR